jgi:hypothetical protein
LNNAIKDFDGASDIILFLREQWAGLFQRYLQERERINEQSLVKNLQSTASTLQNLVTYFNKMGIYLTQVTTTCSVFGGGRLSARFAGVGAPLFD